jgi:Flp pilus assembly pilin Flp
MKTLFNRFANDESGATAIEYGLIAAVLVSFVPSVVMALMAATAISRSRRFRTS